MLITIGIIIVIFIFSRFLGFILFQTKNTEKIILKENSQVHLAQESTKINYLESSDGKIVPIPQGFTASQIKGETSVEEGLVIYEGNIDWESMKSDTNLVEMSEKEKLQLQSQYNQYVWIPVEKDEISSIYGVDRIGKLWGKLYSYTEIGRVALDWKEKDGKMSAGTGLQYFEPGLGYGSNNNFISEMEIRYELGKTREELASELEQSYYQVIKSIKKYGGFYIGRYETAIVENQAVSQRMKENLSNQSWVEMYQKTKKMKGEKDNIVTSMVWSSLWDYVLEWFVKTGRKTYEEICYSNTWGNYRSTVFEYYIDTQGNKTTKNYGSSNAKIIPTGASDIMKTNNIYDMAGNVNELTLGCYAYYVSYRGGYYNSSATEEKSCGYREYQTIQTESERTGSRAILFFK